MSGPASAGARCASHPEAPATWTCKRCGAFICEPCERRVRADAMPLCPGCWALRSRQVAATPRLQRLESAGLWLGALSLTCLPPVVLASLVINLIALARAEPGARRKPVLGLGLTAVGLLMAAAGIASVVSSAR